MNKFFFVFLVLFLAYQMSFAQDVPHRRSQYFETYLEIKEPIDSIVIYKSKRDMIVFHEGKKVKLYKISLGIEPIGKKEFEGDLKTPEGLYYINERDSMSSYHKNIGISYPNAEDSIFAATQNKAPGGAIKIHGFPNKHLKTQEKEFLNTDWTLGCIAVSDFEIDELYRWVIENCPINILP
ncbi:MAG: L,D-transpeptidase family protein [Chitinophagaceae bacterium]